MPKMSSELARLLAKYPSPNDPRYAPQVEGKGNELRRQFPGTYGAIGGFMGTAPDEFERGSVLDSEDAAIDAQVRKGAELGYPVGMAANVAPIFSGLGKLAAKYAPVAARNAMAPTQLSKQAGVIKMKGGNWLSGSVEDALKGLKRPADRMNLDEFNNLLQRDRGMSRIEFDALPQPERAAISAELIQNPTDASLNSWIDKQLTRYVKNEMATPEDPIRALAERGVLHYAPQETAAGEGLRRTRKSQGFPESGMAGTSDLAQTWETNADFALYPPQRAGDLLSMAQEKGYDRMLNKNPWLGKVPPETLVNEAKMGPPQDLGLSHLIDELRNATDPNSGLPADLLLKYDALDKVSVPQAVERVAKINAWREAQKAEADLARANNAATVLHKDYPDNGFKWVELAADKADEAKAKALADALKYEGDTMGHCVGGYCPDVLEGKSRIYSLRDAKGRPHVTIEASPDRSNSIRSMQEGNPESFRIVQIKGKGNKAPNPEYLPYVQDFVKSGKWSDVGDLQNAGLQRADWQADTLDEFRQFGIDAPTYGTADDINKALNALNKAKGFAKGGRVTAKPSANKADCGCDHKGYAAGGLVDYDPGRIDAIAQQLRAELAL